MPIFSATCAPSVVGLYVDEFIVQSGKLTNLLVLSGGSGYSASTPPTVVISGGGGSGAQIEPVILNGEIISVNFVENPNLGILNGSTYTSVPTFSFVGGPGSGASMTCSLSQNTTILGIPANEESLLQFCFDQGINYLALYDLRFVNWRSETSTSTSSPGKKTLADFIAKAKSSGITEVGAVTNGSISDVNSIIAYQNSRTGSTQRFDWINLEKEYWNGDGNINSFLNRLTYIREQATGGTPYIMGVEVYLGIPSYSNMVQMVPLIDRLLLDDFSSIQAPDYSYTQSRLLSNIGSACTFLNTTLDIMPIFSAERVYSPWNADYEYMGLYYTANTLYSSWYNWAVAPSGYSYNRLNRGSYNNETSPFVRNRLNPVGQMVSTQQFLRVSNPPTLPSFVSYVTANGPTTFNTGQSVLLTANPSGFAYEWYPYGETGQTISAGTAGNYSVSITNCSGVTSVSSAVTITVLSATCQADIYYDGPTTFFSGGTLVLTANTGTDYYWIPNGETGQTISVTESGDYQVYVGDSFGCTGTSQILSVTVNPCATSVLPAGPMSAITGDVVILSAMTTGTTYLWSPYGETTPIIAAFMNGNYSVQIDNGEGCVATSNSVSVTFLPCIATISYEGSTTLISGDTLLLTAAFADSYYWYPNGEGTQVIAVQEPGTYSVRSYYYPSCTAYSESVTVNVVTGTCTANIFASGPLYYSSGNSINSVTLTTTSGSSYYWSPNGETTQSIVVSGSGIYSVMVDNGYGCTATTSIVVVANNYDPVGGFWTEDNYSAVLNSKLESDEPNPLIPWTKYSINLTDSSIDKYFAFFRIRSKNGKASGLRFAVNDINNFIPLTGIRDTSFGWYRVQMNGFATSQIFSNQANDFYVQLTTSNTEISQFVVSSDKNFIPGPYPNYSYA